MVMLLRDLHYDHLDRLEGHRTASLQRHGCCATCQIITETVPSVHGAELSGTIFTEPLPGELPPLLGCNPKRLSNSSPDGDIPYSPLFQATMLPSYSAWLGAVALTVLFGELSCHKSQVLQGCEKLSASTNCDSSQVAINGAISRCQRVGHQGLLNTLASFVSWSPPNAVHH